MKRVPALDGVRAVAITAVIGLHAFNWPVNGACGVDIFFVLSGFLITTLLMNEWAVNGAVHFRGFYARRVRRLLPALVVTIVGYLAVSAATDHRVGHAALAGLVAGTYTTNLVVATGHPGLAGALPHTWSLAAEEQFYLLWPAVLFLALRGRRLPAICLLLAAIAAVTVERRVLAGTMGVSEWRLTGAPDTRSIGLAMGCLCALCFPELHRLPQSLRRAGSLFGPLALSIVCVALFAAQFDLYRMGGLTIFCAAVAVLLVRATSKTSLTARALSLAPLVWLGRISYSLYLYHLPIFIAFGVSGDAVTSRAIVAIALSVTCAALSFRFVEQPFLRRSSRSRPARVGSAEVRVTALEPVGAER